MLNDDNPLNDALHLQGIFSLYRKMLEFSYKAKALRVNHAHSHEKKLLLRNRARRVQESCAIDNFGRVRVWIAHFLV